MCFVISSLIMICLFVCLFVCVNGEFCLCIVFILFYFIFFVFVSVSDTGLRRGDEQFQELAEHEN